MSDDLSGLPPAQPQESGSLSDHEAAFGPNGTGELPDARETEPEQAASVDPVPDAAARDGRDEHGRFQKTPRHRAKSQQASPGDVPRIQELTAKLRAAEAERDALKTRGPVNRLVDAVIADRGLDGTPQPQAPAPPRPPQPHAQPQPQAAQTWQPTRPEPSEDEIGDKYPTYAAFTKDQAKWVHEQERAQERQQAQFEAQQQTYRERVTTYETAQREIRAKVPDFDQAIQAANQTVVPTTVIQQAIFGSSRSAEIEYYLATHLDEYRQLVQDSLPINHVSGEAFVRRVLESRLAPVASTQRSPTTRTAAGVTGAAPPNLNLVPAPRPPTPVRTGPLKIGDDAPDDDAGLDAHEAYFHRRR